ncbi:MAG: TonB-dependent receptor [Ignavibacterium sp.]|nr:TonB-dependent receptor [Ignavibacterium sp.]
MKHITTIKLILILHLIILFSISTFASLEDGGKFLSGKVIDADTKEPLIGANILIKNTNIGTATDIKGFFFIKNIPNDDFEVQISMIGYRSFSIFIQSEFSTQELTIELHSSLIELGTIVVTGTNTLHLYENVPVKTELISKKLIHQQGACNLAEALGLQTGVLVENNCNNCNFTQVRILGFDGKYSQVLIDGDPVISSLGGVYGLEHYPKEMIEQIEIVKGGGSSLYGGGAIAGTINLMTRRPAFNNTRIGYTGSTTGKSYDQQIGAVAEIVNDNNTAGFFIFGSTRNRNPYDHNGDGFSEIGLLSNETLGVNSYFKPFNNTELKINFHRILEERRGGNNFDKPVHEAEIAEWTKHIKWGGKFRWEHQLSSKLQYRIHSAFSLLKRDSYYGGLSEDTPEGRLDALNFYGLSENPLYTFGLQVNYIFNNHSITAGVQYNYDKLLDRSVSSEAYYLNEIFRNTGIFLQDEFAIGKNNELVFVIGSRIDKHSSIEEWIVSPRLNAKYQLNESLKLRAGFTTGFKAPQIFDEDLHICGLEGIQRVIRNEDGLKEERSSTYSLGLEFLDFVNNIPLLFGITAFYTDLENAYTDEFITSSGNIEFWERVNSTGAFVQGLELDLGVKPFTGLELRSGITFKENKYRENLTDFDTDNFLRTPDLFGYIRGSYDIKSDINFFVSMKYLGSMFVPRESIIEGQEEPLLELNRSEDFFEFDIAFSKHLNLFSSLNSSITFGVKNLFNAYQKDLDYGQQRDPAYVYGPSLPRTFYLNLNLIL